MTIFFTYIFYIIALYFILINMLYISAFNKSITARWDYIYGEKYNLKRFITWPNGHKLAYMYNIVYTIPYLIWMLIGLFTFQYYLFVGLITYAIINGTIIQPNLKKFSYFKYYDIFDTVLHYLFFMFLFLNKFHFHLTIFK